ncbi:MAG: type II toxin-antitoxin system VapC family toxin [Thiolinea sp.]
MRRILLDTNLLIAALDQDNQTSIDKKEEAVQLLTDLLNNSNVALAITPLIRYEVLRGIAWKDSVRYEELKDTLKYFEEVDIGSDVSELAANLYRFDIAKAKANNEKRNFEKRKFDIFHLASAQCHKLELVSQDSDIAKLQTLYIDYIKATIRPKKEFLID